MLRDIVKYKQRYQHLKRTSNHSDRKKIHEDLLVRFLCTIQKEEGIGVKKESETISLMRDLDEGGGMSKEVESMLEGKTILYERNHSLELPSIELDKLDTVHEMPCSGATPTKSKVETINLYKAYKHIKDELQKAKNEKPKGDVTEFGYGLFSNNYDDKGFIEVESLIKYTHKILMANVVPEKTSPGRFSTNDRIAEMTGGILYKYPKFENEAAAEKAVQTLVDKVNEIIESIKQMAASEEQKVKLYFKCSSLFLFCFLTLHPFSDGNGRLARLLSSYNLLTYSPFLTPIYNVFSASRECDYVQALIDARQGLAEVKPITARDEAINLTISIMHQKPEDLCSMLIESNWTVWRQLLIRLDDPEIKLYSWEVENQTFLDNSFEGINKK